MTTIVLFLLSAISYLSANETREKSVGAVSFPDGKAPDGTRYKTAYRCEDDVMSIGCKRHERIHVIRANYGRFSIAICNKQGYTDWSVNCMSPETTRIVRSKCDGMVNCSMPVNSHLFGEPCPGTRKYVEVHYACASLNGGVYLTTPKLPPWLSGKLWQDEPYSYDEYEDQEQDSDRKPILVDRSSSTPLRIPITTPKSTTTSATTTKRIASSTLIVRVNELAHADQLGIISPSLEEEEENDDDDSVSDKNFIGCSETTMRYLHWNRTLTGQINIQPCPAGTTGLARMICNSNNKWNSAQPDMSDCKSLEMTELEKNVREEDPENVIVSKLSILSESDIFLGGDLEASISIMQSIANRLQYLMQLKVNLYNKESFVSNVFQNILRSTSNLLNNHVVWKDFTEMSRRTKMASELIRVLEEHASLLASTMNAPENFYESSRQIVMSIAVSHENIMTFPINNYYSARPSWFSSDFITLATSSKTNEIKKYIFFAYENLNGLLASKRANEVINSRIISCSGPKHSRHRSHVTISFRHLQQHLKSPTCVYWNFDTSEWSKDGCVLQLSNSTHSTCLCDHFTNFALLMYTNDFDVLQMNSADNSGDHITIQIISSVVSIISFILILLIVIQFRKQIRRNCFKCHNLCCCQCSDTSEEYKHQDFYTGASLMETASRQQIPLDSNSYNYANNRHVGIIQHHYNTSTSISLYNSSNNNNTLMPQQQIVNNSLQLYRNNAPSPDVLYAPVPHQMTLVSSSSSLYGASNNNNNNQNSIKDTNSEYTTSSRQTHQERKKCKIVSDADDKVYNAYHSESSSSGVSAGSSGSSRKSPQSRISSPYCRQSIRFNESQIQNNEQKLSKSVSRKSSYPIK